MMQKSHDREPKDVDLKTMIEDIYIDGSGGAEKAIDRTLPDVRQHRDLQHIKKNIGAWKGKFNNEAWRPWLKDAIEFLAKLPCKQEFEAVSHNLISMFNRTDLANEQKLAQYLTDEVFQKQENGSYACTWRSGLDSVEAGYRTYVSNNEERFWRTAKHHLGSKRTTLDVAETITKLCQFFYGMVQHKDFAELFASGVPPLTSRFKNAKHQSSDRQAD